MEADYVQAGGTQVLVRRWEEAGGRPVVYWHGGGGASSEIPRIGPELAAAGYSVYGPDAPGYGGSPALEKSRYRSSALGDLAAALIDALGIRPAVWVGSSWGAVVGIYTAVRAPGYVRALALLDGGYFDPRDDPDYDPSLDLATRIAELRARAEQGESWDASPELIAAVMEGVDREPPTEVLPKLQASGIPILPFAQRSRASTSRFDPARSGAFRPPSPTRT